MSKKSNFLISKSARLALWVAGEKKLLAVANKSKHVNRFGEMLELKIDKGKKEIFLSILLKGEECPTEICIEQFEVVHEDDCVYVQVESAISNRAWISALLKSFVIKKKWAVPEDHVIFVNDFLE